MPTSNVAYDARAAGQAITMISTKRPKNANVVSRVTTSAAVGELWVFLRYVDAQNYIRAILRTTATTATIVLEEFAGGVRTQLATQERGSSLVGTYDFFVKLDERSLSASVNNTTTTGVLGSAVFSTPVVTVSRVARGTIGQSTRDTITLTYIRPTLAEYARFESTAFPSISPIKGLSLSASTSPAKDLIEGLTTSAINDASISAATIKGVTGWRIVRSGVASSGGIRSQTIDPQTSTQLILSADIHPVGTLRGTYYFRLRQTSTNNVLFAEPITTLVINQWNHYEFRVLPELLSPDVYFEIQQDGTYADEFYVANMKVLHEPIRWEATVADPEDWRLIMWPNRENSGVLFDPMGTRLKVRAIATTDDVRISGYAATPIYKA